MVDDFHEFSEIITNPVERLHLKKFIKSYSATQTGTACASRSDDTTFEGSQNDLDLKASCWNRNIQQYHTMLYVHVECIPQET